MSRLHDIKKMKGDKHFKELYDKLDHEAESKFDKTAHIKMINQLKKAKK